MEKVNVKSEVLNLLNNQEKIDSFDNFSVTKNQSLSEFISNIPESKATDDVPSAPSIKVNQSWARFETLRRANGELRGCWNQSFSGACGETIVTAIQIGAILFEQSAGNCANGSIIWVVTHS